MAQRRGARGGAPASEAEQPPPPPGPSPLDRAVALLASRERTVRELEAALARRGVPEEERAAALARVKELGYIDDASVARARAKRLLEKGGAPRLAERKLVAQGVSRETAQAASREAAGDRSEAELAREALQRRLRGRPIASEKERQRLLRLLVRMGHRPSAALAALKGEGAAAATPDEEWDGGAEDVDDA